MTSARVANTNKAHECAEDEAGARRESDRLSELEQSKLERPCKMSSLISCSSALRPKAPHPQLHRRKTISLWIIDKRSLKP